MAAAAALARSTGSIHRLSTTPNNNYNYNTFSSTRHRYPPCWLSMNGCGGGSARSGKEVGFSETRTLASVSAPELAVPQLKLAVSALEADPPQSASGIIRLQVPIRQRVDALEWLQGQVHYQSLPRCFFSSRGQNLASTNFRLASNGRGLLSTVKDDIDHDAHDAEELVSVAGIGSAVFFQGFNPFALHDWQSIRRFLSKDCPLIRAYGAMRFDARTIVAPEWKNFGSFYFIIPQVEFDQLQDSSVLALTIAWDNNLIRTWQKAIDELKSTVQQISSCFGRLRKLDARTTITNFQHFPSKGSWDISVKRALDIITNGREPELVKVVLARCSKYVTDTTTDPLALLANLKKVESENAYQFYIQPPDAPAFIGNTPEQLFHRKCFHVTSEALAGTRARGVNKAEDLQIGQDLLYSPKDNIEFSVVRDSIRRKLENICDEVIIEPNKALRKLPRVQHLSAQLSGRLRDEDNEFDILTSLHPSPAVCGLPTEDARLFIKENEMFDRGMYAGPVGWFGGRESEFAVGIRSALVGKGLSTLVYAGAGIVKGTNPSSEWEELDLKASQVLSVCAHTRAYIVINSPFQFYIALLVQILFICFSCPFQFTKLFQYQEPMVCSQEIKSTRTAN
ncbi:isochorismate synthase, chloroplastic isoform X1 [Canna indica]|uniref:isochorismate synthase n=1 Tax=Canna indica TaxID=4628 RepID=A0AAQ3JKR3_9LILI|nr:isochorismate synthase, chloroplastic isoform X1 [Canna indica]